jgi:uncharacterized protein (DUF1015 family)
MANIFPFRNLRFNPNKVGDLADVLTQPYDKITPEMQQRYYAHPHNLVRIILGKGLPGDDEHENVYTRAAELLHQWIAEGIIIQDDRPGFYAYYQRYQLGDGPPMLRKGLIGLGQLEDYSAGIVFPHERTLAAPKADRLRLLRATRTHFEQLFMLYADPRQQVEALMDEWAAGEPETFVRDEYGVEHRIWKIADEEAILRLQQLMADKSLIIADGHHRYETALAYRDEQQAKLGQVDRGQPYERMMFTFVNTEGGGLTILPTHRLIKSSWPFDVSRFLAFAERHFDIERYAISDSTTRATAAYQLQQDMDKENPNRTTFGLSVASHDTLYRLTFRPSPESAALMDGISARQRTLDVAILHSLIIEHGLGITREVVVKEGALAYVREFDDGIRLVDEGAGVACFFVNATRIDQVRDLALIGEVLPQKSTDFYPKLLSGLTIFRHEE